MQLITLFRTVAISLTMLLLASCATLQGMVDDLNNASGLSLEDLQDRFGVWLGELDRNYDNVLTATGMLASLDENRLELKSNVSGKFVP